MVSKLVTLSFDGSVESGLKVSIKISEELSAPYLQETGWLPKKPEIVNQYHEWRRVYQTLEKQTRTIQVKAARIDSATTSLRKKCHDLATILQDQMNAWLDDPGFNAIRRAFYREVSPECDIRILIQSDDPQIWRLPWHLWSELENYPRLEFGFSKINYSKSTKRPSTTASKVRILAIFGDSQGLDLAADQAVLNLLPNAKVEVLQQPSYQEFSAQLWEKSWDVLFFAGHSRTVTTTGHIQLNKTDSLTISQLKHSLRQAIDKGLQIAIFNSCDGLGLAWDLDELNIPQMVLMREIVPDLVAQKFLQFFLASYSVGMPLYTAVRQARDRLESLESRFPCATWLPVIYQNPAFSPPTWPSLQGTSLQGTHPPYFQQHQPSRYQKTVSIFGLGLGLASIILGVRFAGGFQLLELKAYDALLRWTPEKIESDPNIIIVEITEEDLNIPEQQDRVDSLSPTALHQLLTILNRAKARVIGLNIYRDRATNFSTSRSFQPLQNWANTESPLITLCRIQDRSTLKSEVSPPPNFPITSVGFSDQVADPDGVVRRHLLAMKPEPGRCIAPYSFSLQLALRYLAQESEHSDIPLKFLENGNWKIGQSTLIPLKLHEGVYHQIDSRGIQLILNYRGSPNHATNGSFQTVTLAQILHGQIADEVIKDRIVIIGTTAESYKDYHKTPFGQPISGVLLQAHMTSHLIDLALDRRSLVWTWPAWLDGLWIGVWTTIGVILATHFQKKILRYLALSIGAIMLSTFSWAIFVILNGWIPLIPGLLGFTLAGLVTPRIIQILTRQQG